MRIAAALVVVAACGGSSSGQNGPGRVTSRPRRQNRGDAAHPARGAEITRVAHALHARLVDDARRISKLALDAIANGTRDETAFVIRLRAITREPS